MPADCALLSAAEELDKELLLLPGLFICQLLLTKNLLGMFIANVS